MTIASPKHGARVCLVSADAELDGLQGVVRHGVVPKPPTTTAVWVDLKTPSKARQKKFGRYYLCGWFEPHEMREAT